MGERPGNVWAPSPTARSDLPTPGGPSRRTFSQIVERRICALGGRAFALVKCEWAGLILTLYRDCFVMWEEARSDT